MNNDHSTERLDYQSGQRNEKEQRGEYTPRPKCSAAVQIQTDINISFFSRAAYFGYTFSGKQKLCYFIPIGCCKYAGVLQFFIF